MVAMHLAPEVGLEERLAADSFVGGWASERQFNVLADCRDLLAMAAMERKDRDTLAVTDLAYIALLNIKDRYAQKKRMGATGEEVKALRVLVDTSEDFWNRQSGELFRLANVALDKARGYQREARS